MMLDMIMSSLHHQVYLEKERLGLEWINIQLEVLGIIIDNGSSTVLVFCSFGKSLFMTVVL